MKIGEIAKAAGVTTSRIRFYEREGIIPAAERGPNGYRDYDTRLITLLQFIEQAQSLGFTLREISDVEIGTGEHIVSCTDALALLGKKREAIIALIAEARERKRRIEALMAELEAGRTVQPVG
ncbi:MerR family transcriptional regulator [Paracoccus zhejiangensis]|uniref:MerR family transcriptional regulator n=1 Tax=Paracoccus zhejiangensis TaxID=1077935 RepID=A0A2H5F347_9RHOB|nr:MerR family transcriptional regulator [Paracoccus zhejiangensis]AUH65966.1 MerR family transcriptional regulator [Paracoccus zhejiangensis]